jgi:hypothetical protein
LALGERLLDGNLVWEKCFKILMALGIGLGLLDKKIGLGWVGGKGLGGEESHLVEILREVLDAGWVLGVEDWGVVGVRVGQVELVLGRGGLGELIGLVSIGLGMEILVWGVKALRLLFGIWVGLGILGRIMVVALGDIFTVHRSGSLETLFGIMGFAVNECFS